MNKTKRLGTESIFKLLISLSTPAIIGMMVNAIYNIVDRLFISNCVSEDALGGLTVAFPVMMLIAAFGTLIGVGGSALISNKFGEHNLEGANKIFGNTLTLIAISGTIMTIGSLLSIDSILSLMKAEGTNFAYAKSYLNIIFLGIIFQLTAFVLSSVIRNEGKAKLSMFSMIASALTNIVLDYIFIVRLNLGVEGAAFATIIGQFVGFIIVTVYFLSGKSIITIKKEYFKLDKHIVTNIFSIGSSAFLSNVGTGLSAGLLTAALITHGGDPATAAMGGINSIYTIAIMPMLGLQQGFQPIVGYNYGAKNYKRVQKTFIYASLMGMAIGTMVLISFIFFGEVMLNAFLDTPSTIEIAKNGLNIFSFALPILGIAFVSMAYLQATRQPGKALMLNIAKQFLILIPLVYILPQYFDLNGVWLVTPITDTLSIILALILIAPSMLKKHPDEVKDESNISDEFTNETDLNQLGPMLEVLES